MFARLVASLSAAALALALFGALAAENSDQTGIGGDGDAIVVAGIEREGDIPLPADLG